MYLITWRDMSVLCLAARRWDQHVVNTLRPRGNKQDFADDIFKRIFFEENVLISIKISLKFVPKGPINNISALIQIVASRRSGGKPLSEPMMVNFPTHICITRPQCVKKTSKLHINPLRRKWPGVPPLKTSDGEGVYTSSWWRHQMETFSAKLALCAGEFTGPGEFPTQRPVTWSFDVLFDLGLNKPLSKQL